MRSTMTQFASKTVQGIVLYFIAQINETINKQLNYFIYNIYFNMKLMSNFDTKCIYCYNELNFTEFGRRYY